MNPITLLRRVLQARPEFIRLLTALFAVLVLFDAINVTEEQFAGVVLAVEALFSYVSKLAFERDLSALQAVATDDV